MIKAAEIPEGSDIDDSKLCPNYDDMTPEQYRGTVEKYDREESKKNDEKRKQKEKGVDKESEMMEEEHGNVGDNKMKKMKPYADKDPKKEEMEM